MRSIVTLLLIGLTLAGCVDEAPDEHADDCDDAADHDACHAAQEQMEDGPAMNSTETVTVSISWDGVYRVNGAYSQGTITVPANSTVELTFTNNDQAFNHDFVVEGIDGAATNVISNGQSETITFQVGAPEALKFFCSVTGHRGNGMEGDFVIE